MITDVLNLRQRPANGCVTHPIACDILESLRERFAYADVGPERGSLEADLTIQAAALAASSGAAAIARTAGPVAAACAVPLPKRSSTGRPLVRMTSPHCWRSSGRRWIRSPPAMRRRRSHSMNQRPDWKECSRLRTSPNSSSCREFDLLLTDLDLPGIDGARLAAMLTQQQPHLEVIVMSGYPDDGTLDAALGGRPAFLRKPFSSAVLLAQIEHALAVPDGSSDQDALGCAPRAS